MLGRVAGPARAILPPPQHLPPPFPAAGARAPPSLPAAHGAPPSCPQGLCGRDPPARPAAATQ
eukprot:549259-Rhodomonas_salina.2